MIPEWTSNGVLPPGIHAATLDEVAQHLVTNHHRLDLFQGLKKLLKHLKEAGCQLAYLDGSYVTSKYRPNDYDLCWDPKYVDIDKLNPCLLDFSIFGRKRMKFLYLSSDIFIATNTEQSSGLTFLDFFQHDSEGRKKGIIKIRLQEAAI
jgi:hypothetical protein